MFMNLAFSLMYQAENVCGLGWQFFQNLVMELLWLVCVWEEVCASIDSIESFIVFFLNLIQGSWLSQNFPSLIALK